MNIAFLRKEAFMLLLSLISLDIFSQTFTEINANLQPGPYDKYKSNFVYWADFDNDGDLDLLMTEFSNESKLYVNNGDGSFTAMAMPSLYGSVDLGDYNNDGLIDIALASSPTYIFKNNGGLSFSELPASTIPTDSYAMSVDWGDFDNDGYLDLLARNTVFRNDGGDSFTLMESIVIKFWTQGVSKWVDYNNDGWLDIIFSGNTGDGMFTWIYKNCSGGHFEKIAGLSISGGMFGSIDWGDYDNDGDPDLLLTGYNGEIFTKIYKNNGGNNFSEQSGINLPGVCSGSANWGDFDNDGVLDILISGYSGINNNYSFDFPITKIYKNAGNNTFELYSDFIFTGLSGPSAWGDYDNDGALDFAVIGNTAAESIAKLYKNNSAIKNVPPQTLTGLTSSVDKSDITLSWANAIDDKTSALSMTYNIRIGSTSGNYNIVSPHSLNNGNRGLAEFGNAAQGNTYTLKNVPLGDYWWSVQAVDNGFAGGNFPADVKITVAPQQAHSLSAKIINDNSLLLKWERGNGDRCAVFCKQTSNELASPKVNTGYIADSELGYGSQIETSGWYCIYNGRSDSVTVTGLLLNKQYSFHIFEYIGNFGGEQYFSQTGVGNPGVFSTSKFNQATNITFPQGLSNKAWWGDFNNDGLQDILVTGNPTHVYRNNGDNTFNEETDPTFSFVAAEEGDAAWGDYNNDGYLDILITGNPSSPISKIYRNDAGSGFTEVTSISLTPVYQSSVAWGDYDNDGDLDILMNGATGASPNFNPVSKIYNNDGNGNFTEQSDISLMPMYYGSVNWGDYDNDGDLDILLTGRNASNVPKTLIYKNNGNGNFIQQTNTNLTGYSRSSASFGDYDNDGDLDIIIAYEGMMKIYENTGNGSFQEHLTLDEMTLTYPSYTKWYDFNNDGYLDFIFTNPIWFARVYLNTRGLELQDAVSKWFILYDEDLKATGNGFADFADYDNDGDIDILFSKTNSPSVIKNNLKMKSGEFSVNVAPAAPTGITELKTPSGVWLKWDPVRNDETDFKAMTYNVRIGTSENTWDICPPNSSYDNGYRKIPGMGNAQTDTSFLLVNLPADTYYWSVQAVDQASKGSNWSNTGSFEVKNVQTFYTSDEVCLGLPTHFLDQSVASKGISSWKWEFGDYKTSSDQNPVHTYAESGSFNAKLVITDSGGTKDSLIQIVVVKPKPIADFSAPAVCQGTAATITNTTNKNGLTISSWYWDFGDGQTSLSEQPAAHGYLGVANYTVVLKVQADNACIDTVAKTVSLVSYPIAAVTANAPLTFCRGDSVTLSVPYNIDYNYTWKLNGTGISGADSSRFVAKLTGKYIANVVNSKANCQASSSEISVEVKQKPSRPDIDYGTYKKDDCLGENPPKLSVDNVVSGYSYQWYKNETPLGNATSIEVIESGNYYLEAVVDICTSERALAEISFKKTLPKPDIIAKGPTIWYLSTTSKASYYRWYYNGNQIPGADNSVYVAGQKLGTYRMSISDDNSCFVFSNTIEIPSGVTGIEDTDPFEGVKIYPNPTTGIFTIEMNNNVFGELIIDIFTQTGSKALNIKFEKTTEHFSSQIDLSGQPNGMYLINLSIDKFKATRKILVE
jgi:PKD repeat protein